MVSKKGKREKIYFSLFGENGHDIEKKVALFNKEWVRNSTPRDGQKIP